MLKTRPDADAPGILRNQRSEGASQLCFWLSASLDLTQPPARAEYRTFCLRFSSNSRLETYTHTQAHSHIQTHTHTCEALETWAGASTTWASFHLPGWTGALRPLPGRPSLHEEIHIFLPTLARALRQRLPPRRRDLSIMPDTPFSSLSPPTCQLQAPQE